MLTEKEFELIKEIAFSKGQLTQRELAEAIGFSLGTINRICNDCINHIGVRPQCGQLKPRMLKIQPFWAYILDFLYKYLDISS